MYESLRALSDPQQYDHEQALKSLSTDVQSTEYVLALLHVFSRGEQYESIGSKCEIVTIFNIHVHTYICIHIHARVYIFKRVLSNLVHV